MINPNLIAQNTSDENKKLLKGFFKRRRIIKSNIAVDRAKNTQSSRERISESEAKLEDIEESIYEILMELQHNSTINESQEKTTKDKNAFEQRISNIEEIIPKLPVLNEQLKISHNKVKSTSNNTYTRSSDYKASDIKDNPDLEDGEEQFNYKLNELLDKETEKLESRSEAKAAAVRQRSVGLFRIKNRFKSFSNSALYKLKPFKTRAGIEANNEALYDERSYWVDREQKFKRKLLVFSLRGSREAEIKKARKEIKRIDGLISDNDIRLVKKSSGIISKISNAAYRLTGAETEDDQTSGKDVKDLINLRKSMSNRDIRKQNKTEIKLSTVLDTFDYHGSNFDYTDSEHFKDSKKTQKAVSELFGIANNEKPESVSDILDTNEDILEELREIKENQIDEQDTSIKNKSKEENKTEINVSEINEAADSKSWLSSVLPALGGALLPLIMGMETTKLTQLATKLVGLGMSHIVGNIDKIKTAAIDNLLGLLKPIIDKAKSAAVYLENISKPVIKMIDNIKETIKMIIGKVPKIFHNIIPNSMIEFAGIKKVSDVTSKAATTIGKSIAKKLPIVGLGISTGLAVGHAIKGDFGLAGAEMVSGVLSMFPGLGTIASIGIDAAILHKMKQNKKAEETAKGTSLLQAKIDSANDLENKLLKDSEIAELRKLQALKNKEYTDFVKEGGDLSSVKGRALSDNLKQVGLKIKERRDVIIKKHKDDFNLINNIKNKTNNIKTSSNIVINNTKIGVSDTYNKVSNFSIPSMNNAHQITASSNMKEHIKNSEGFSANPYWDVKGYSVGYGHLIKKNESHLMNGVNIKQADKIFNKDYAIYYNAAKNIPGYSSYPDEVKNVLIDMTYNMGVSWYKGWPNTINKLQIGDYEGAAVSILNSKYAKQVKSRAVRNAETIRTAKVVSVPNFSSVKSNYKVNNPTSLGKNTNETNNNMETVKIESNKIIKETTKYEISKNISNNTKNNNQVVMVQAPQQNKINNIAVAKQKQFETDNNPSNMFHNNIGA